MATTPEREDAREDERRRDPERDALRDASPVPLRDEPDRPGRRAAVSRDAREDSGTRDDPHARKRVDPRELQERVEERRAAQALRDVRDPAWWNKATAQDIERVQAIAQHGGASPAARQRITSKMNEVAQARYGTDVDGAIRWERSNPTQPPPAVAAQGLSRS